MQHLGLPPGCFAEMSLEGVHAANPNSPIFASFPRENTLLPRCARHASPILAYELSKYASSEFLAWAIRAHDVNG